MNQHFNLRVYKSLHRDNKTIKSNSNKQKNDMYKKKWANVVTDWWKMKAQSEESQSVFTKLRKEATVQTVKSTGQKKNG